MPPKPILKEKVETLAARGWSIHRIADHLETSSAYVHQVVHRFRGLESMGDRYQIEKELDAKHVDRCEAEGGFPFALVFQGETLWLNHSGGFWRHVKGQGRAA